MLVDQQTKKKEPTTTSHRPYSCSQPIDELHLASFRWLNYLSVHNGSDHRQIIHIILLNDCHQLDTLADLAQPMPTLPICLRQTDGSDLIQIKILRLIKTNLILDVTYANTTNLNIYLSGFIVLECTTFGLRFTFYDTEGVEPANQSLLDQKNKMTSSFSLLFYFVLTRDHPWSPIFYFSSFWTKKTILFPQESVAKKNTCSIQDRYSLHLKRKKPNQMRM